LQKVKQIVMKRYLAVDLGEKRVGLAISDPSLTIAQPLKTVNFKTTKKLFQEIEGLITSYSVEKIIVGLPLTMKGTYSQKTREVEETIRLMRERFPVGVEAFDERLTTVQAEATLRAMGKKPSRERKRIDQLAAVHLLQCFLDCRSAGRG